MAANACCMPLLPAVVRHLLSDNESHAQSDWGIIAEPHRRGKNVMVPFPLPLAREVYHSERGPSALVDGSGIFGVGFLQSQTMPQAAKTTVA